MSTHCQVLAIAQVAHSKVHIPSHANKRSQRKCTNQREASCTVCQKTHNIKCAVHSPYHVVMVDCIVNCQSLSHAHAETPPSKRTYNCNLYQALVKQHLDTYHPKYQGHIALHHKGINASAVTDQHCCQLHCWLGFGNWHCITRHAEKHCCYAHKSWVWAHRFVRLVYTAKLIESISHMPEISCTITAQSLKICIAWKSNCLHVEFASIVMNEVFCCDCIQKHRLSSFHCRKINTCWKTFQASVCCWGFHAVAKSCNLSQVQAPLINVHSQVVYIQISNLERIAGPWFSHHMQWPRSELPLPSPASIASRRHPWEPWLCRLPLPSQRWMQSSPALFPLRFWATVCGILDLCLSSLVMQEVTMLFFSVSFQLLWTCMHRVSLTTTHLQVTCAACRFHSLAGFFQCNVLGPISN